jgi:hypothetical protein
LFEKDISADMPCTHWLAGVQHGIIVFRLVRRENQNNGSVSELSQDLQPLSRGRGQSDNTPTRK